MTVSSPPENQSSSASPGSTFDVSRSGGGFVLADLEIELPVWEFVLTAVCLSTITVFTIVGNILVIVSVVTYRPLRIVQNFFIASLAIADLTVAVFVLPLGAAYTLLGKWIFGLHLCRAWLTVDILCCTASILNLCAIALDRYWAIADPINYAQKRTRRRVLAMIGLVWAISVVICLPPLFGWNDWSATFTRDTPCEPTKQKGYVVFSSVGSFYCPLLIMVILNVRIFRSIRSRLRKRASRHSQVLDLGNIRFSRVDNVSTHAPPPPARPGFTLNNNHARRPDDEALRKGGAARNDLTLPNDDNEIHQVIRRTRKISLTKERRAARTLGIIMGAFVVCWLPFFLMYVILPFCPSCSPPSAKLNSFIIWLGYINSSLNPVIYTFFNQDFSKALAKILRRSGK
ncbi:tyramine receptor 1-like [Penaeus japonicus]|uniref:tyramine receptor 1-like n=1 Tax=Penaeus japonicus TaxID=27405 RepID=UPI001C71096A|nr:tyramine receptor 1-like [Penaeus japonicus]XP_042885663.1 tyramine receptor 1-like [Penaeus japonicus]XP_042885669.1 tyramine receptor 1-like [Penaeus japonicus]XP_042885676.1 tyramine receptor 1-like [Penaeus japonicus]